MLQRVALSSNSASSAFDVAALTAYRSLGDMAHRSLDVAGTKTVRRNCVASVTSLVGVSNENDELK